MRIEEPALLAAVRGVTAAARGLERRLDGMSLAQLRVLTLVERDPLRASELAHGTALSRPTLSGLLDGLDAKGWIDRHPVEGDRRGVRLSITVSGRRALVKAQQQAVEALETLLDELEPADRRAAVEALGALAEASRRRLDRRLAGGDPPR